MTVTLTLTAADGATHQVVLAAPVVNASGTLPPGVTLQGPDGGLNYYANNSLTYAANMGLDTTFFPMGPFNGLYSQSAYPGTPANWASLGWNCGFGRYNDSDWDTAAMLTNHVAAIENVGGSATSGTYPNNFVGFIAQDEPDGQGGNQWSTVAAPISGSANVSQDHRFWYVNFTGTHWFTSGTGGTLTNSPSGVTNAITTYDYLFTTPNGTKRHIDMVSADVYWFSASRDNSWNGYLLNGPSCAMGQMYGTNFSGITAAALDAAQRGSNYGDMIDVWRAQHAGHYPAPSIALIETGDPFSGDPGTGADYIKPPELNWACWSSIIHGVRGICFFDINFSGPGGRAQQASSWYTTVQSGQTISMFNQIGGTCKLISNLAPIINSDFALGYASVSPSGYAFPTATLSLTGGIEIMTKYYQGAAFNNAAGSFATDSFYIFATTRYGQAHAMPVTATFTVASGSTVTVIGENRTIPIVSGKFTDTFAKASTVHIYQIS